MAKLHEIRNARAEVVAKMRALAELDEALTPEQEAEFDTLKSQTEGIDARIARLEQALQMQVAGAVLVADAATPDENQALTAAGAGDTSSHDDAGDAGFRSGVAVTQKSYLSPAEPAVPVEPGIKAARFVIGLLKAKGIGHRAAADFVMHRFGDAAVAKALNTAGTATGGALIPQQFANEIIELLRARTVVRGLGPQIMPMVGGNLTIPRQAAGAQSGYQGELDDIALTQASFDALQLNAKKLVTMTSVSNDLIRRAPFGIEGIVRDDLLASISRREDLAFLIGDGSGGSPVGLLNLCAAQNKLIANPFTDPSDNAAVLGQVVGVLNGMALTLEQGMSSMIRPAWIMAPQVRTFLKGLRDNQGAFVFKDELDGGTLHGYPFATTQQLPTNLNTGTTAAPVNNGSFLYLVDMADVILAETYGVTVEASDVASFKDSGGNTVNAFQRDLSVFRVITEHDLNIRHQASLAVAVLPGWAPPGYNGFGPGAAFASQPFNTLGSAAPSTGAINGPTGSNNPANVSANVPGGTQPGRA